MAEVIQICFRDKSKSELTTDDIEYFAKRVLPDHIPVDAPTIIENDEFIIGVLNPRGVYRSDDNIGLGTILENDWNITGAQHPSGSYAIFRNGSKYTEFLSDIVGSRTIWYGFTEELFIASTLQRGVVTFLQEYTPDPKAEAWMISAGMLGPFRSWAKEVKKLPPNSILRLDRDSWDLELNYQPAKFETTDRTRAEHYQALKNTIEETFSKLSVSQSTEILTLSGGYDSRVLFEYLSQECSRLTAVTWGSPNSIQTDLTDASIAERLCDLSDIEHRFYPISHDDTPVNTVVERFINASEGRIDHLAGYLDGFSMWENMYSLGVSKVIRGDEGFGWVPPITRYTTERDIRQGIGLNMVSDYPKLSKFNFLSQSLPERVCRNKNEKLGDWRDRLYQEIRIPTILAALNSIKSSYVEVSNPFLSKEIIQFTRQLPVSLRDNKSIFRTYADSLSPDVPYVKRDATPPVSAFFNRPETISYFDTELETAGNWTKLPPELFTHVREHIEPALNSSKTDLSVTSKLSSILRQYMPRTVTDIIKRSLNINPSLGYNRLALRIIIISRMNRILYEDSNTI